MCLTDGKGGDHGLRVQPRRSLLLLRLWLLLLLLLLS
jgi:hypothetical protein